MNGRVSPIVFLNLLNLLTSPLWIGCRELPPDMVEFGFSRLLLPPGAVRTLVVFGMWKEKEGPRRKQLTKGLLFHSDREHEFSIDPGGTLTLAEDILSGESARISVRTRGREASLEVIIRKNLKTTVDSKGTLLDPAATDSLVNKARTLPADYVPADLRRISVPTVLRFEEVNNLRHSAKVALSKMFEAALAEGNLRLYSRSGYRSYKTQEGIYNASVKREGKRQADRFSAAPGHSEHQTGLAVDITSRGMDYHLKEEFGTAPEGLWAAQNAHRFGFILRYPKGKENITGYGYEPWHFRYVGEALGEELFRRGLTLEEFYALPEREG